MSIFTKVKMPSIGSSRFNLSHDKKLSFDMGELIPTCLMDVIPGDSFKINVESMFRFAPLIAPIMHKVKCTTSYFFVPNRIVFEDQKVWEDFITGESDAAAATFQSLHQNPIGSLGDYLGYPTDVLSNAAEYPVNAIPVAAYMKIYDEYYRDENLIVEQFIGLTAGNNPLVATQRNNEPLRRSYMHDYFTSALPFAQKGDAVTIPAFDSAPDVVAKTNYPLSQAQVRQTVDGALSEGNIEGSDITPGPVGDFEIGNGLGFYDPNGTLAVDTEGTASTIETLRKAFRLQEWLEKNARGGTRYIEHIKAHFGVFSSDKRLQRPEYIGGYTQNMIISEVLATAQDDSGGDSDIPVGEMAGHGISVGKGAQFKYRAEEHGFIIGITSVQPVTAYQQGVIKMLNRPSHLDYYYPSFANLGEQEIKNSELYVGNEQLDKLDETFGYIPRYAEYKYMNSMVHGDFRDNLSYWHLGRIFDNAPALNQDFLEVDGKSTELKRIFAVQDESTDSIWAHIFNNITAKRKMPKYAIPSI